MADLDIDAIIKRRRSGIKAAFSRSARTLMPATVRLPAAELELVFAEVERLRRELDTMTDVARGNKDHVAWLTAEYEKHEAEIARLRAGA